MIPWGSNLGSVKCVIADIDAGILFVFAVGSLGVYGIVLGGWSSNSKYPFLGAIRSTAQLISYLRLSGCKVGLLINFNVKWLVDEGIKRIVNGFPD